MVIFGKTVCCLVLLSLSLFLLRSCYTVRWPPTGKTVLVIAGALAVQLISGMVTDHPIVHALGSMCMAGLLCWYLAEAKLSGAAILGSAFGLLHLTGALVARLVARRIPGTREESMVLTGLMVVYALTVLAAVCGKSWRLAPMPALQLLPVLLVGLLIGVEMIRNRNDEGVEVLTFLAFVWMLYAGVMLIPVGKKLEQAVRVYWEKQQKTHYFVLQEEYYQQLRDKQTETRALWHDLHKYLRSAQVENDSTQALMQLESMLDSATQIVDVGNQVLNVILNEYVQMAKAMGITLRLKVQVPPSLPMAIADLYILLGNTLDNAVEACRVLPQDQRAMELILRTHNDILYYKLVNPCLPGQRKREPSPMHGHGLKNVQNCIEKYGGFLETTKENGFFIVTAHLNLSEVTRP